MVGWAALDFEGGRQAIERVGIDPQLLSQLGNFPDWQGRGELGWSASERGFRNGGNECYMISLIQMLGTSCRVRQAICELPVRNQAGSLLMDQTTRVLQQDFGRPNPSACASGRSCHLFTEGRAGRDRFAHGAQQDAEEALRFLMDAWATAEGTAAARGRDGFATLGVGGLHQLFSVVLEWRRGCARCKTVSCKLEESLTLPVSQPPGGRNRETRVKWQLENFGAPEPNAKLRCGACGLAGACIRRQYLTRLGPLLIVQLEVYDTGTRQKLLHARIHADERLTLRVGGNEHEYELVAAVEHLGNSLNIGHYVCYRRDGADGSWVVLNDDGGTRIGLAHRSRLSAEEFSARQMYLCMYARAGSGEGMLGAVSGGVGGHAADASTGADELVIDVDSDLVETEEALVAAAQRLSIEAGAGEVVTTAPGGRRSAEVRDRSPPRRTLRWHVAHERSPSRRSLRRSQHPKVRMLRRSAAGAMTGDEVLDLSASFRRLGVSPRSYDDIRSAEGPAGTLREKQLPGGFPNEAKSMLRSDDVRAHVEVGGQRSASTTGCASRAALLPSDVAETPAEFQARLPGVAPAVLPMPPAQRDDMARASGLRAAVPRRTVIGEMGHVLAENEYVESEMRRRDFHVQDGQWVDGVLLPGDPVDGADLEAFLRDQFRAQAAETRAAAWGPGQALGRR